VVVRRGSGWKVEEVGGVKTAIKVNITVYVIIMEWREAGSTIISQLRMINDGSYSWHCRVDDEHLLALHEASL
jgi:hypothetical protein